MKQNNDSFQAQLIIDNKQNKKMIKRLEQENKQMMEYVQHKEDCNRW